MTQFVQQFPSNTLNSYNGTMFCLDIVIHKTDFDECSNPITVHITQHNIL